MEEVVEEVNITQVIIDTINSLCQTLIDSINNSIFNVIDDLIFVDGSLIKDNYVEKVIGGSNGIIILANALVLGFILYYGCRKFTSYYTGKETEPIHKFIVKSIVVVMLMNFSLYICESLLDFNYSISEAICMIGKKNLGNEISFSALLNNFSSLGKTKFNLFSINGLLVLCLASHRFL